MEFITIKSCQADRREDDSKYREKSRQQNFVGHTNNYEIVTHNRMIHVLNAQESPMASGSVNSLRVHHADLFLLSDSKNKLLVY